MNLTKYFSIFKKEQKKGLLILFFFMTISALLEMLVLGMILPLIGAFIKDQATLSSNFILSISNLLNLETNNLILAIITIFILLFLIKIIFQLFYYWYESKFIYNFKQEITHTLFYIYLNQNFNFFFKRNSSEFIRNVTLAVDHIITYYLYLLKLFLEIFVIIAILIILFYINFFISLFAIIYFSLIGIFYYYFIKKKIVQWGTERLHHLNKTIQYLKEAFENIKIVKILNRELFFLEKFQNHNFLQAIILRNVNFFQNLPKLIFELVFVSGIFSLLIILSFKNTPFNDLIKIFSVFLAASFRVLPSINRILTSIQLIKLNYPSVNVLENEIKDNHTLIEKENKRSFEFKDNIKIKVKNFSVSKNTTFQLKDINIQIKLGEKIGIVGPSGSGKSTLIDLLAGFYDSSDMVIVDGKPISKNVRGWQNLIGYVPQNNTIIDDTLKNNIIFGLDNSIYSDETVIEFIKKVNLLDLIKRLPNGIHSKIDEKGINLSGGEIQRIGICRALILRPKLLILDEVTSALDTNNAKGVYKIFTDLNLTTIGISHREDLFENFDKILKMRNGKLENY
tara:strand:- start:11421 stop:13121 length:1701 start_codon:yes stop_codon:yes gene_type:complete